MEQLFIKRFQRLFQLVNQGFQLSDIFQHGENLGLKAAVSLGFQFAELLADLPRLCMVNICGEVSLRAQPLQCEQFCIQFRDALAELAGRSVVPLIGCGGKFKPVEGGLHFDRSLLKATEIDLADCPDLGPILFTLGCFCSGETVIRNAGRLRLKESDRIGAMQTELRKMGARIEVDGDTVHIQGVALHAPNAPLSGHNDHRVVMSLAVLALAAGLELSIDDAEAVQKSWPHFFEAIKPLGAEVEYAG